MPTTKIPRVFVSYAHEANDPAKTTQSDRVKRLVEDLRFNGFETHFDAEISGTPPHGWPAWMAENVREADFVLVVCTATYLRRFEHRELPGKGKGAIWEGAIIEQELYDSTVGNNKFAAVLFDPADEAFKPAPLKAHTHYSYPSGMVLLVRWISNQPEYVHKPLGVTPKLPPNP